MDKAFKTVLETVNPEIIHINHLSHLSTGIIDIAFNEKIPVVFTLHDYWLGCPRGQFLQMALGEPQVYPECSGQENKKCAVHCMSRMWGGVDLMDDEAYWTRWVELRQKDIQQIIKKVSVFISPSFYLKNRIIDELGIPSDKIIFEPYGFQLNNLKERKRVNEKQFVFGYIGRIDPSKGIDLLIRAFGMTTGSAKLRIWGRTSLQDTPALMRLTKELPEHRRSEVEWLPEYENNQIVKHVFNRVDCLVVPSIWIENSPLVIQEALQAKVLVITSEKGGMGELVKDGVNGITFQHRSIEDLSTKLQFVIDNPQRVPQVSQRGFLHSADGSVHNIEDHVQTLIKIFESAMRET
jgi:glycosyltransferase involved in cell wall biosynthesis